MQIPRIDPKNVLGLVDKVVGLGKEILGTLTGQDRLARAGQVQQEKATERLKAIKSEVAADAHKTQAAAAERAQQTARNSKEKVNA